MKRVFMMLVLLLGLPTLSFAIKIKDVDISPSQPKAGDTVLFTVKTDKNAAKVEIDFPAIPGPPVQMKASKDGNKWQIKFRIGKSGEKTFKVTAYDSRGKKDSEKKKFVVGNEERRQPEPQQEPKPIQRDPLPVQPVSGPSHHESQTYKPNLDSPLYNTENPLHKFWGHCTWFVWGRSIEATGSNALRSRLPRGNATTWWATAKKNGFNRGQEPRKHSIAVWGDENFGHVAFVENVSDGKIVISEANYSPASFSQYGKGYQGLKYLSANEVNSHLRNAIFKGYIYIE